MDTQAVDRFQREYQEFHKISKGRQRATRSTLRELSEFAGKPILECTGKDLRAYLGDMLDRKYAPSTIGKKLKIVKPFFAWCWEEELVDAQRMMEIQRVKAPRGSSIHVPKPYSRKELKEFRRQLDRRWPEVDPKFWERWRRGTSRFKKIQPHAMRIQIEAIIALALHCGLRCNEIFSATIDNIHHDNAYVVVPHGKGDRYREVPHTAASRAAVQAWLELRTELAPSHDRVWLSLAWEEIALRPMNEQRFGELLHTIGPGWRYHRFRHTCGTEWLRATKRLEVVQKLLGHASITQTLGYAQLVNDDILLAVGKAEADFEKAVA